MSHTLRIEVTGDHNDGASPDSAGQYPVELIRKRLAAAEVYPEDLRYDADTDTVQWTPDGGSTWEAAPGSDPRNQTLLPPQVGDGSDCNSAASAVEWLHRYITLVTGILSASGTLVQGITAIMGFLGIISGGFSILWEIIGTVFGTLQTYGAAAVTAAMTDTVYDDLRCIIYCNIDGLNQVDEGRFATILAQVDSIIGGTAGVIIHGLLSIMGYGGLNNVMAMALADDTCDDCGCDRDWCFYADWTTGQHGFVADGSSASYSAGNGWRHGTNTHVIQFKITLAAGTTLYGGEVHQTWATILSGLLGGVTFLNSGGGTIAQFSWSNRPAGAHTLPLPCGVYENVKTIVISIQNNSYDLGTNVFDYATFYGPNAPGPFEADNCADGCVPEV